MWYLIFSYTFLFALLSSALFTFLARRVALYYHFVDIPNAVKIHNEPKPLLGGMAIFLSFLLTIIFNFLILIISQKTVMIPPELKIYLPGALKETERLLAILAGGFLMMLLGLYDDKRCVTPYGKLLSQILIATMLFFLNIRITLFMHNIFISYGITCLWVVFVINAFNLLDNMDGLAAGVAFIAALLFFSVTVPLKQYFISIMLVALAGSVLGFLFYNFNPASIFMGDCGSLFIGYIMAVLTMQAAYIPEKSVTLLPVITPVLILAIPLYDTVSVIIIRTKNKKSLFKGDNNHFSHRLVRLGMSAKGAVLFIYLISFAVGLSATILPYIDLTASVVILIQAMAILLIIALLEYFGKIKHGETT